MNENFEDRLQKAFRTEQATLEQRRLAGTTAVTTPSRRNPWAFRLAGAAALCLAGLVAFIGINSILDADKNTQEVATLSPTDSEPASASDSVSASAPAIDPGLPEGCFSDGFMQIVRVTDVAVDDPDGGLVVHSSAGVDAPVVGVLPFYDTVRTVGPCTFTPDGADWVLIESPAVQGWVNARYLTVDPNAPAGSADDTTAVQVFFGQDPISIQDFEHTVGVTRWTDRSDLAAFLWEQLKEGPTAKEKAAGLFSPFAEPQLCPDIPIPAPDAGGVLVVSLCPTISATVFKDPVRQNMARDTFAQLPGVTAVDVVIVDPCALGAACADPLPDAVVDPMVDEVLDDSPVVTGPLAERDGCTRGTALVDEMVFEPKTPGGESPIDHVTDLRVTTTDTCTTVVIQMGATSDSPTPGCTDRFPVGVDTDADGITDRCLADDSSQNFLRPGIAITREGGATEVSFGDWFSTESSLMSQEVVWGGGVALVVAGTNGEPDRVWITNGLSVTPVVSTLSNPARIVIGFPREGFAVPFWPVTSVSDGERKTNFYVDLLQPGPDGVEVHGYGQAFEASGTLTIWPADQEVQSGQVVPGARIVGGTARSDTTFSTGNPGVAWAPFSFTIVGLEPGVYQLGLDGCDQCEAPETFDTLIFTVEP